MRNGSLVIFLFLMLFLTACGKEELLPADLIQWVENEENGLLQRQEFENYFFEAKYKPLDYIISVEGRTNDLSSSFYSQRKEQLDGMQYVDINIGALSSNKNVLTEGITEQEEYFERLDYFVTYANQDIFMTQGKDTLYPKLYHFERNYGLAPKNTLLLGFDKPKNEDNRSLFIDDQILGVGRVKFTFHTKDIQSTPLLKTREDA